MTSTLTPSQQKVQNAYQSIFGRDASFGTLGGANYWVDQIDNQNLSDSELNRILTNSAEGQSVTTASDGTKSSLLGGVDPSMSMAANAAAGNTWASHFVPGGVFGANADGTSQDLTNTIWSGLGTGAAGNLGTDDAAGALNAIAAATGTPINNLSGAYYNQGINAQSFNDDGTAIDNNTIVTNDDGSNTGFNLFGTNYADMDALKAALGIGSGSSSSTGGVDDFMKFMMFMSMMRPQGGGGYGGSQYGYGGLNPGGVQAAYNPMDNITSAIQAFQSLPGIGTGNVNTGTAGN